MKQRTEPSTSSKLPTTYCFCCRTSPSDSNREMWQKATRERRSSIVRRYGRANSRPAIYSQHTTIPTVHCANESKKPSREPKISLTVSSIPSQNQNSTWNCCAVHEGRRDRRAVGSAEERAVGDARGKRVKRVPRR